MAPEYLNTEFMIEYDVFFSDLSNLGGPIQWKQHYKDYQKQAVFNHVQTQQLRVKNAVRGICEFVPVNFTQNFFSLLNTQVQSSMLDFKFRATTGENIAGFFFADRHGKMPSKLNQQDANLIYSSYKGVVQRMH